MMNVKSIPKNMNQLLPINDEVQEQWQSIVELLASLLDVKVALINRLYNGELENMIVNEAGLEYYNVSGLGVLKDCQIYCERVISEDDFFEITNADKDDVWKHSIGAKKGLITYLGCPIHNPDGELYGTLCLLDDRKKVFKPEVREMMLKMAKIIEDHLILIQSSNTDYITGFYNRKTLSSLVDGPSGVGTYTTAMLIDIDMFEIYNNHFGRLGGDRMLKQVTDIIRDSIDNKAEPFRYSGDEFFVLFEGIGYDQTKKLAELIRMRIAEETRVTVSIGVAEVDAKQTVRELFIKTDKTLFNAKNNAGNIVMTS